MNSEQEARIERCLAPLERFEALRERTSHTGRMLDLAYPNVPGPPHESVRRALVDVLSDPDVELQYTPFGGATVTRRLVARALAESHGQPFHWRHVVLTPGAMAALNLVFRALAARHADGEVIVVTPCWIDYPLYLANAGLRPVFVPVHADTLRLDVDRIRGALSAETRAIVLSHPANPTGLVYTERELRELAGVLGTAPTDAPPLWISDECHRDYVFGGERFVSPATLYSRCCVVYSFGKALQIQGQRLGYVALSPELRDADALASELERFCRVLGFGTPTVLMQLAVRRLVDFRPDLTTLAAKRERALRALADAEYRVVPSDATWFLYPWTPGEDGFAHVEELARRGVLALPADVFWHCGHIRIALTAADETLDTALGRLRQVVTR